MKTNLTPSVLGFTLILFAISACSPTPTTPAPIVVQTKPIARSAPIVLSVDELNLRKYEWIVVTEQNYQGILMMLRDAGEDPVLYALTPTGYVNLTMNQADILKVMRQQKEVIAVYKRSYED